MRFEDEFVGSIRSIVEAYRASEQTADAVEALTGESLSNEAFVNEGVAAHLVDALAIIIGGEYNMLEVRELINDYITAVVEPAEFEDEFCRKWSMPHDITLSSVRLYQILKQRY